MNEETRTEENEIEIPQELKNQLKGKSSRKHDQKILNVLDRQMSLDEILLAAYQKYGKVYKRRSLSSRLTFFMKQGLIQRVKSGVYAPTGENQNG